MKINCLKQKLLTLATLLCFFTTQSFSQTGILVTYYDGNVQSYTIATTGKLYFNTNNLLVATNATNTPTSIPISIIRKITFTPTVLPLNLVGFALKNEKKQVVLSWKTENEINTSHFIIERSVDGINYVNIGQVVALNNNTGGSYSFADVTPQTGIAYYRLMQVDADGKYVYSEILKLNRGSLSNIILLPNPAASYFSVNGSTAAKFDVKVYSVAGQLMISGKYSQGEQISVSKLTSGIYVAVVNNQSYKLIKQ